MLKENLLSILAALGKVQVNAKDEEQAALVRGCRDNLRAAAEQAEALENNLHLRLVARGIKVSGEFPARAIREVM